MTIKITKQLATVEDLAIGTGTVVQERNGVQLTLTKIDLITRTELAGSSANGLGADLVGFKGSQSSPAYLKTISDIINGYPVTDAAFLNNTKIAAIRAGTSDYDALPDLLEMVNSGARKFFVGGGIFNIDGMLITPDGSALIGVGSGAYIAAGEGQALADSGRLTCFQSMHSGADSVALRIGKNGSASNFLVRPSNYEDQPYYSAEYVATGTADIGIDCLVGSQVTDVTAMSFAQANIDLGQVTKAINCHSYFSRLGYRSTATDGSVIDSVGMFCTDAGCKLTSNYWKTLGGRFEWNARYGIITGAEAIVTGATLDRNGWSGVKRQSGLWGGVISACYFSRNGVGGNGTSGRWGFSVPGHPSYLATSADMSAHIQIDYDHALSITGNRYRFGLDDANQGASGPAYNYTSESDPGATTLKSLSVSGNIGAIGSEVLGYNLNYPGQNGYQCGGSDNVLKGMLNRGLDKSKIGVEASLYFSETASSGSGTALTVEVPKRANGTVMLYYGRFNAGNLANIHFTSNATGGQLAASVVDLVGSGLTDATITAGDAESLFNSITFTFSSSMYTSYKIDCAGKFS